MKTGYKVCDAMTEKPVTIGKNISLVDCANMMKEHHVGAMIVNEKEGLFILTEQDIVRKAVASGLDPKKTKVSDLMTKAEYTIEPQQDIFEALVIMRDFNIRHLPVVDGKNMIGLLTLKDVLKIEPQLFDLMVDKFELREEERKPLKMKPRTNEGVCNTCGNYAEALFEKDGVMVCEECAQD
jgi:signal-transduction protein with cAMP-binding, CBS, and nucleotidyltransferase domain